MGMGCEGWIEVEGQTRWQARGCILQATLRGGGTKEWTPDSKYQICVRAPLPASQLTSGGNLEVHVLTRRPGRGFESHGVAHALSSEPFSLVRGATAIISPLGLTSTSVVAMLTLLVGAIGTGGSLAGSCALSP